MGIPVSDDESSEEAYRSPQPGLGCRNSPATRWHCVQGKLLACLTSLCLIASCLAAAGDYCSLKCLEDQHTMCRYKKGSRGSACAEYHNATLNDKEKKDIVHIHNMVRLDVATGKMTGNQASPQPKAADMMQLVWDEELATVAQRWADQCVYEHDSCRKVGRFDVGQNVAMRTAASKFTSEDLYANIDMWVDEVDKLKPGIVQKYTTSDSDHYTQLVWAATGAVGCGATIYKSGGEEYTQLLVCNYGPAGNRPSKPVYVAGQPCTACPEGTSCSIDYKGLCFSPDYAKRTHSSKPIAGGGGDQSSASPPAAVACGGLLLVQVAISASRLLVNRVT